MQFLVIFSVQRISVPAMLCRIFIFQNFIFPIGELVIIKVIIEIKARVISACIITSKNIYRKTILQKTILWVSWFGLADFVWLNSFP